MDLGRSWVDGRVRALRREKGLGARLAGPPLRRAAECSGPQCPCSENEADSTSQFPGAAETRPPRGQLKT